MLKKCQNRVTIEGWLKDNSLKQSIHSQGNNGSVSAISGSLSIMTAEHSEYRVQFYAAEYWINKDTGEKHENPAYKRLAQLLPHNTRSLAALQQTYPDAKFDSVKDQITKIHCTGFLSEYLRKDQSGVFAPIVTYRGNSAYVLRDEGVFNPRANFEIEVFIESLSEETKVAEDGVVEPTGRLKLVGLYPEYDGTAAVIPFVAEEENVVDYIRENFIRTQTVILNGDLVNLTRRRLATPTSAVATFGRPMEERFVTEFISERVIRGGSSRAFDPTDEQGLSIEDMREASAKRQKKIDDLDSAPTPANTRTAATHTTPATPDSRFSGLEF